MEANKEETCDRDPSAAANAGASDAALRHARDMVKGHYPSHREYQVAKALIDLASDPTPVSYDMLVSLTCTAQWLENGCDPKEAAKEIRLNLKKLHTARQCTTLIKERRSSLEWAIEAAVTKGYTADADVLRTLLSETLAHRPIDRG